MRDSATCDEITGLDPDTVATQARMLLEDMPVTAFKIGAATRAEVVSDYDDVPLILAPDFTLDDEHVLSADELRESLADLLVPQTTMLIADSTTLLQLAQPDSDAEAPTLDSAISHILAQGCEYVLAMETGTHRHVNTLYSEEGQVRQDMWDRGMNRVMGLTDTLGAAVAALLANGQEPAEAAREAQEYVFQAARAAFRPGMGAYLPNRFFWARSNDADEESSVIVLRRCHGAVRRSTALKINRGRLRERMPYRTPHLHKPGPQDAIRIGCAGWGLSSAVSSSFPGEGSHLERYAHVLTRASRSIRASTSRIVNRRMRIGPRACRIPLASR